MKHYKMLSVAALTLLSNAARSECDSFGCTGYVEQLYVEANGSLWLQTSGNETFANCTPNSGMYLKLPGTDTNSRRFTRFS